MMHLLTNYSKRPCHNAQVRKRFCDTESCAFVQNDDLPNYFLEYCSRLNVFFAVRGHVHICESTSSTTLPSESNLNITAVVAELSLARLMSSCSHVYRL